MTSVQIPTNITSEVAFGETREVAIIRRWVKRSSVARRASTLVKTPSSAPFDFLVLDKKGFPIAYLEVKRRRTALVKFGDAICPVAKHNAALRLSEIFAIPSFLVTEYGCGSLIEVPLTTEPREKRNVVRRDRPGSRGVPHAFYALDQLTVLERETP